MKICWDNLEGLKYNRKGYWRRGLRNYYYCEACESCGEPFLYEKSSKGQYCSYNCVPHKISEDTKKRLSILRSGKFLSEEHKKNIGLAGKGRRFSEEHRKKISLALTGKSRSEETKRKLRTANTGKRLSEETKKKIADAERGEKNWLWKGGVSAKNIPLFDTYANKISWCEEVRRDPEDNNILQAKCTYCGKWYRPTLRNIGNRIEAINGRVNSENRLYCSEECKKLCPIFKKIKYSAEETNTKQLSREVQSQLRQMVFERDNWICVKCGSGKSLHCHHKEGIHWNPIESADIDICETLCEECHKNEHTKEGLKYSDLRCNK